MRIFFFPVVNVISTILLISTTLHAQVFSPSPPSNNVCETTGGWFQIRPNTLGLGNFANGNGTEDVSAALGLPAGSVILTYTNATSVTGGSGDGHFWQVSKGTFADPYSAKATFSLVF